jgi:hypothetical protein
MEDMGRRMGALEARLTAAASQARQEPEAGCFTKDVIPASGEI